MQSRSSATTGAVVLEKRVARVSLFQIFGIESFEVCCDKTAVFADARVVEVDFPAAVFRGLDEDHIPMYGGSIAVVRVVSIGVAGREVE